MLDSQGKSQVLENEEAVVDTESLRFLQQQIEVFMAEIKAGETILVGCHPDADGFTAGAIIKEFLERRFQGRIGIDFCHYTLESEEFRQSAEKYDHIITGDLWIPDESDRQKGLGDLLARGKQMLVIDHHDSEFEGSIREDNGTKYDPSVPETLPYKNIRKSNTKGQLIFVSPKRLGFSKGDAEADSTKLTGGILAHLILNSDLKDILPISAQGDAALDFWPIMKNSHAEDLPAIVSLAGTLNLGDNLSANSARTLIEKITASSIARPTAGSRTQTGNIYEDLLKVDEVVALTRMQDLINERAARVVEGGYKGNGIFHYHVEGADVEAAKRAGRGELSNDPSLLIGMANAANDIIEGKATIFITQFRMFHALRRSFHIIQFLTFFRNFTKRRGASS